MSEAVNKVSARSGSGDYSPPREKVIKNAAHGYAALPIANEADVTSYSALLDEVYDGDLSEFIAVGQNDRRTATLPGSRGSELTDVQKQQSDRHPTSSRNPHLEHLRQSRQTQHVATTNNIAPDHRPRASIKSAHDRFMLTSSHLNCPEAGSQASLKAFLTVVTVLHKTSWERMDYLENQLVQNQMAAVL